MKTVAILLTGVACLLGRHALAGDDQPRGAFLELHSCELYAGGCIVSSEATLEGRYMLRAWDFSGGSFAGTPLSGLQVAVLQSSPDNLADQQSAPGKAIVYLPEGASAPQRTALLKWLKTSQAGLNQAKLETRTVPLHFGATATGYEFSAGTFASIKTAPIETCRTGACGEALWYAPRSQTSVFTVAVDNGSRVNEPWLQLKWHDAGKRSVFVGKFGKNTPAKALYVSATDLCAPGAKLF